jgi:hypothetical protein
MWTSIIAVVGTLAGGLLTGGLQARITRAARREEQVMRRHDAQVNAVVALVAALEEHRRAMWTREDIRLNHGADNDAYAEARATSHATRVGVSEPMTRLAILAPDLHQPAKDAATAVYAMRGVSDHTTLNALYEGALQSSDRLVAAAGAYPAA